MKIIATNTQRVFLLLNRFGVGLLVCALLSLMKDLVRIGAILLTVSIVLMIPDSLFTVKRAVKHDEPLTLYWISKFAGLLMCFVLLVLQLVGVFDSG